MQSINSLLGLQSIVKGTGVHGEYFALGIDVLGTGDNAIAPCNDGVDLIGANSADLLGLGSHGAGGTVQEAQLIGSKVDTGQVRLLAGLSAGADEGNVRILLRHQLCGIQELGTVRDNNGVAGIGIAAHDALKVGGGNGLGIVDRAARARRRTGP